MMSSIEIRPVQSRIELEAVYELLDTCFPLGKSYFQSRLDHSSTYRFDTTWVAVVDGVVASTIQVFPYICRIEEATLKVAGIGSVATRPEFRGQGLGLKILHKSTEWMAREGYDLSLLFAVIHPFYEKLGWAIVPEMEYQLTAEKVISEASRMIAESGAASLYSIQPFDPSVHTKQVADIYEQINNRRTLSRVRTYTYWQDMLQSVEWRDGTWAVALQGDSIAAYGRLGRKNNEAIGLEELCYLPGHESAILPLVYHLLEQHPDVRKVQFSLPPDHALLTLLKQWHADEDASNLMMWKLIRLAETLHILRPVLQRRLQYESVTDFRLAIACEGQSALLIYEEAHLAVVKDFDSNEVTTLKFRQSEFVSMLFHGYISQMTIEHYPGTRQEPHPPMDDLLQILFPAQNSVFYLTDKF
ncbi:GNAT family N-acetyltransferase [Paenibacillus bouchesdurhonensis]|uniref:GNAT family N-acetyltransferase n=1 Tax=Paenibacillus bouchesdurhonensis TaxID=1870990 RepID=UPI001F227B19|nr:GNAT family N-acetyltransferase [Paenibacillus bouchesdurhonensis]